MPQIHETSFPYPAEKRSRWELFTLWRIKQRILPLNSECLSFGVHRQDSTLHVFGDLLNVPDVILLIQYSTNDKWKSGKNWPFINEFSDSSKPEELPTTVIYIHTCTCQGPHIHAECRASHVTLPTYGVHVTDVTLSFNAYLHVYIYKQMHGIVFFTKREQKQQINRKHPNFPFTRKLYDPKKKKKRFRSHERQHEAKGRF